MEFDITYYDKGLNQLIYSVLEYINQFEVISDDQVSQHVQKL